MAEERIYLDNDLTSERVTVNRNGRDWLFVWEKGTVEWWLRWQDWSDHETDIIQQQGRAENLKQLYDLASEVLCPENGKADALRRIPPSTVADLCGLFAFAWFKGGTAALIQVANERQTALSMLQEATETMTPKSAPPSSRSSASSSSETTAPRRTRRSA